MNAQLANISFLVLLCSMICYWIGPLSRDIFGNFSSKNMPSMSQSRYAGISENNFLDGIDIMKYQDSGKDISNNNSIISFSYKNNLKLFLYEETRISAELLKELEPNATFVGFRSYIKENLKRKFSKFSFNISNSLQFLGRSGIILSNVLLMVLLCNRWRESGHFPLSNLYESLMFLSWSFTVIHLFIENITNSQTSSNSSNQNVGKFIGAITTPSALFTNAFATFTLPKEMQGSSSLVPALQSNWLMMHVTVMIISYAALILGSLLSIAYLIITVKRDKNMDKKNLSIALDSTNIKHKETTGSLHETSSNNLDSPSCETIDARKSTKKNIRESIALTLDNLSYRILGIGFPFLTIGILSGAVWANEAWGSYWSWDPKETWAFLTWLVYAIYLHTRLNKGWEGQKPAIIASLGFIVTWICYLGVNLIGEGLHSYGWIVK
jgi:cytochrome c-type biogenesis protein CcsB